MMTKPVGAFLPKAPAACHSRIYLSQKQIERTMTFCLGIKIQQGLVALADTQIVKGGERLSKAKVSLVEYYSQSLFIMTSGLRSVRDKTVIYTEEQLKENNETCRRLYQVANLFGSQLRRVKNEDGGELSRGNLSFNLHAIIGGQLSDDPEPTMFYIYPEGNWIEATADAPYFVIGRTPYCKPILDRLLQNDTNIQTAAGLGFLAFDATRTSVTDVDYPLDMIVYEPRQQLHQHRYSEESLQQLGQWWQQRLTTSVMEMPLDWTDPLFQNTSTQQSTEGDAST